MALCTACDGGTASTSAWATACGDECVRGGGAACRGGAMVSAVAAASGCTSGEAAGIVGRATGAAACGATGAALGGSCAYTNLPDFLVSTAFLNCETLRNESWANW